MLFVWDLFCFLCLGFHFLYLGWLFFNDGRWLLLFFYFNRRNRWYIFLFRGAFNTSNLLLLRRVSLYELENLLVLLFLLIIIDWDVLEIWFLAIFSLIILHLYDFSFKFIVIFIFCDINLNQFSWFLVILQLVFLNSSQH